MGVLSNRSVYGVVWPEYSTAAVKVSRLGRRAGPQPVIPGAAPATASQATSIARCGFAGANRASGAAREPARPEPIGPQVFGHILNGILTENLSDKYHALVLEVAQWNPA
jgi:hypothetical protein